MTLLAEQIREYAGILNENITAIQAGDMLVKIRQKASETTTAKEVNQTCLEKLNVLAKDWISVFEVGNIVKLNICPMNYKGRDGDIDEVMATNYPQYRGWIKSILEDWVKKIINNLRAKYPNCKIVVANRKEAASA